MPALTPTDKALLAIYARTWQYPGARESAVFEATGMRQWPATQRLNELLDMEAALEFDATTVNRLRRVRDARLRVRAS